ncbi:type II secretion system protein [Candidatus Saccharibacteria bacterium]|nr:type II secretion system protein [Candidatus Saccharibacteria bacterium]
MRKLFMHYHKRGFTIIEVSLVLAIAGLILVMAFIALPALQRQSRDAKRKEDTMIFLQALKDYQQNNRGQLPQTNTVPYAGEDPDNSIIHIEQDGYKTWNTISSNAPWAKFYTQYLGDDFLNPDQEKYTFFIQQKLDNNTHGYDTILYELDTYGFSNRWTDFYIFLQATCENGKPKRSNNSRNVAIITLLETGTYCADM